MALNDATSDLIGRIYESASNPMDWERALHEVRARVDARCLLQSISNLEDGAMLQSIVIGDPRRPEGIEEYKSRAFELDISFRWACKNPRARFCDTEELFLRGGHAEDEFTRWNFNEWIGSKHWIVGYTAPDDELAFGLSAHAWAESGTLPSAKKKLFKLLFEHIERALRLQIRPPEFVSGVKAQILLDRFGYIRAASPAARELLETEDGIKLRQKRLHACDSASERRLTVCIQSALNALIDGGFGGGIALARPSGKRDLLLTIGPYLNSNSTFESLRPAALLEIVDPERSVPVAAPLRWAEVFGFTHAETSFVEHLVSRDHNVRQTAEEIGISYETARVHLKHILEKSGTHSQAQLSRILTQLE